MKKDVFLEKSSKYISIQSYLIGRLGIPNIDRMPLFLDQNPAYDVLGKSIYTELENSIEISGEKFLYYWNNNELIDAFRNNVNLGIMKNYGYKNYRDICKDSLFLSVKIYNNILYITPYHQDGLGTFGTVRDKSGNAVKFEYPINLSDEELGKAVMEAFEYCTSIYKRK